MEITGRHKLIVRENNKIFEAELDLELKHVITGTKTVKFLGFAEAQQFVSGWISCKGFVLSKNVEFTHGAAVANVKSVFAEILEQAFRVLDENSKSLKSEIVYSNGIIKSEIPQLVSIEMTLIQEKLEFKVATSGNGYEEVSNKAKELMKEFIGELQKQLRENVEK